MAAIRVQVTAEHDGELHLRGLPLHKGQQAQVIVLTEDIGDESVDAAVLAVLQHDPAWAWLHDEAEDLYTEQDVR